MTKTMEIRFPAAGVVRRLGYRDTLDYRAPFPSPWAVNVWPADKIETRLRGGSRPGLTAYAGGDSPAYVTDLLTDESGNFIVTEDGDSNRSLQISSWTQSYDRYKIPEAVKAYDIDEILDDLEANAGTAPSSPTIGCIYRDRLVVGDDSNAVYMSAVGDWSDWDYGVPVTKADRAVLIQLAHAGYAGEDVTALIPFRDEYLLAATESSLWVIRDDPASQGAIQCVSVDVGILSNTAWCVSGESVFFLSNDGIYRVGVDGSGLESLSRNKVPEELRDISTGIILGYSHRERGIYIFLASEDYNWFFDLEQGGYWPFTLASADQPTAVYQIDGEMTVRTAEPAVKRFTGNDDSGTDIESYLAVGPIRPGGASNYGMIQKMIGVLGTGSGTVTWMLIPGDTAEAAADNAKAVITYLLADDAVSAATYIHSSGTWTAGRAHMSYPRVRAMWVAIILSSTDQWAYENITLDTTELCRWR